MNKLIELIKEANFVYTAGNGGSSATAEHFANDLFKKGIKAICLNSNTSIMTMIANDFGYEYVFSKQLELYANREDLLIVFSVSGKSPNILKAVEVGIPTIEVFGDDNESYADAENRHLKLAHEIAGKL